MADVCVELARLALPDSRLRQAADYDWPVLRTPTCTWDAVSRVTCRNNCASQRGCSFYAFQKDGLVLRQELVGDFPGVNDTEVPDPNPRGCQKGLVYSHPHAQAWGIGDGETAGAGLGHGRQDS